MDTGGEWRFIRCNGGAPRDKAIIDPLMLRFRPIAPKPVAGGSMSGGSVVDNKSMFISKGRSKRKYVRVRRRNNSGCNVRKKTLIDQDVKNDALDQMAVTTLQLLPEKCDPSSGSCSDFDPTVGRILPGTAENLALPIMDDNNKVSTDRMAEMRQMRVVESWVTVECVTDACMELRELGETDEERTSNLNVDTCPGFISDGENRVKWVNEAFKKMVSQQSDRQSVEIRVWLVIKERVRYTYSAFTCQVKLQYMLGKEKCTKTVPCDVWKMDGGGFAWKLDVKAALTLGPSL